jgi:Spy/CpxP family protein refolding chaperone
MNRIRLLAMGMMVMFALTVVAQQAATQADRPVDGAAKNEHSQDVENSGVPTVEGHLKMLTEKLDLTGDQQAKVGPILQEMHDGMQKLMQNKNMSGEERPRKLRACHLKADKKMREILSDDQKKKLDQLEQDAHMDLHGNVNGEPPQTK